LYFLPPVRAIDDQSRFASLHLVISKHVTAKYNMQSFNVIISMLRLPA